MRGTTLRRRGATPLGDLPEVTSAAQRTTLVRCALALALAATLAGGVLLARSAGSGRAAVLPEGANTGVIVLDMSASVAGPNFERVATVLRGLVAANQAMGLCMFSDTGYELLPPNSPASALLPFERFFNPERVVGGTPIFGQSPWDQFSGGTRISRGLLCAQDALRRAGVTHGSILLLSDLADSSADTEPLVAEALSLRRAQIPVWIVPLYAAPDNLRIFGDLFGDNSFVQPQAFTSTAKRRVQPVAASWPWALLAVGVVLVGLLTANERFNTRLRPEAAT
jgi:hypothetical protein